MGNTIILSLTITDQSANNLALPSNQTSAQVIDPTGVVHSFGSLTYTSATQVYTYQYTSFVGDVLGTYKLDVNVINQSSLGRSLTLFQVINR